MTQKLYIISLGPGDPSLITIQSILALQQCEKIFVPTKSEDLSFESSITYQILNKLVKNYDSWFESPTKPMEDLDKKLIPLYSPMKYEESTWEKQAFDIIDTSQKTKTIGYVTLGDVAVFSSAYYLLEIIKNNDPQLYENTIITPGITSYSYASSLVKKPLCLGDSKLEVLPSNVDTPEATKVFMRFHKGDNVKFEQEEDLYYFENLGLENQNFAKGKPDKVNKYLTLVIDFAKKNIQFTKSKNSLD